MVDLATIEAIFFAALEKPTDSERNAFLDEACGGDDDLRRRVQRMLFAHPQAAGFLNPRAPAATVDEPLRTEGPDTVIAGRYKLLEEIGEGGMGNVWMAEQREPMKRLVAVKLIKPGMDSRSVLARFEAERQALALMDHPNIAKVLDGGTTDSGRPYFVMELVKGLPLTDYCDDRRLSVRERLNLFVQICSAVQHAHQKGVIHRDLKPTNILVTEHDGHPLPKVIDFGLAKALNASGLLTDRTLHTAYGTVVGTPLYMAPEQVGINALDVDTRSDIYALGVILFELLTGTTPLEKQRFKEAAWDEIRRLIREEDPPAPSTRLSTSHALPSLAARRGCEPAKLSRSVRGELDWIVLKSLEKDRNRRYETANGLAMDIQRHLADEPVLACPPSASYRMRKFLRKHRGPVVAMGIIAALLVIGVVGTSLGFVRAEGLRQVAEVKEAEARQAAAAERQAALREAAERRKAVAAQQQAMAALRATTDDVVERLIGEKPSLGPTEKAFLETTLERWQAFAAEQGDSEQSRAIRAEGAYRVADLRQKLGQLGEAISGYRNAIGLLTMFASEFPSVAEHKLNLARAYTRLGEALRRAGKLEEAENATRRSLPVIESLAADSHVTQEFRLGAARGQIQLGVILRDARKWADAESPYRQAVAMLEPLVAAEPRIPEYRRQLASAYNGLGVVFRALGREEAEVSYRQALDLGEKLVVDFPAVPQYRYLLAWNHLNLGNRLTDVGKRTEAAAAFRRAIALFDRLATDFPAVPEYRSDLSWSLFSLGKHVDQTDAEAAYRRAIGMWQALTAELPTVPEYRRGLAAVEFDLGSLLLKAGRRSAALEAFSRSIAVQDGLAEEFPAIVNYRQVLAETCLAAGSQLAQSESRSEAEGYYRRAAAAYERLLVRFPASAGYRVELGKAQCSVGNLLRTIKHLDEALDWYDRAVATLPVVLRVDQSNVNAQSLLSNSYLGQAIVLEQRQRHAEAITAWDEALALAPEAQRAAIRVDRAVSRLRSGPSAESLKEIDDFVQGANPEFLYVAACGYALAAAQQNDRSASPVTYADRAMVLLRQAGAKGFREFERAKTDDDLTALRGRDDFKQLIAEWAQTPKSAPATTAESK